MRYIMWKVVAGSRKRPQGVVGLYTSKAFADAARRARPYATFVVRVRVEVTP